MKTGLSDLNALRVFVAVVESGGFTAAARRLGVAKARVSVQISKLERELGTSLLARTTRKVVTTEAGEALYAESGPLLQSLADAVDRAGSTKQELGGTLRISATVDHAANALAPVIARFAELHPGLHIDVQTSDRVVDLVEHGIDLAIRMGWLRSSSLRAIKLGDFGQWVCAAPAYLDRAGRPKKPADLTAHAWIALGLLPTPLTWKFTSRKGQTQSVTMKSRLRVSSPGALLSLLRLGSGISVLADFTAAADIESGQLLRLLPEYSLPRGGIYAVYPPGRHVPAKVRAFIDFYRDSLEHGLR